MNIIDTRWPFCIRISRTGQLASCLINAWPLWANNPQQNGIEYVILFFVDRLGAFF